MAPREIRQADAWRGRIRKLEADLALAHDLLQELRTHDERRYGLWTGGMRARVAKALDEDPREARRTRVGSIEWTEATMARSSSPQRPVR